MLDNGYCLLADVLRDKTISSIDATDDALIASLIEAASRYIDNTTGRHFYPRIKTLAYDVPPGGELRLAADLLAITTLTNGNGVTVSATDYVTRPLHDTPYFAVRLKPSANVVWESAADGNTLAVIEVAGVWGYHSRYADAWYAVTTLAAGATSSATSLTVTDGSTLSAGALLRCEDEYIAVDNVNGDLLTVRRGVNGSTAAAHNATVAIEIWRVESDISHAARLIVNTVYHNRYGNNPTGQVQVTSAGVVITPQDVPALARDTLSRYALKGW